MGASAAARAPDFVAPQLVAIPAAVFVVRDARTDSSREVSVSPFEIGRTAVTVAQFSALADSTVVPGRSGQAPAHPVTWFDAVRWCNAASAAAALAPAYEFRGRETHWDVAAEGFRLPTAAEWEWACRAGTAGATYGPLSEIAWTAADEVPGPQEVAGKLPNDFGVFDMIGNVWEWCWDYVDTARYADYRGLRGGGWADPSWSCRASVSRGSAPDAVLEDVGFRVARGAVGEFGAEAAQGWSAEADRRRAQVRGPLPPGWTPLPVP